MAQRTRRGFQHYLGDKLPPRISDTLMLRYFKLLRHSKNQRTREIARDRVIMNHVALGFAHATRFVSGRPNQADEIVSEMLDSLIDGVNLIACGAIDHHSDPPNVSGYLVQTMTGRMRKFVTRSKNLISLREVHLNKTKYRANESRLDLRELLDYSVKTEQERRIIYLRAEGHSDRQIGEMFTPTLTSQRINQIRNGVRQRALEYLK